MKKMWLSGSRLTPSCWCDLPSEETQNIRLIRADGQITVTNSYQASYTLTQRWGWHHQRGNSHQNCSYNYFLPLYILYNYMYILLIYTTKKTTIVTTSQSKEAGNVTAKSWPIHWQSQTYSATTSRQCLIHTINHISI